MAQHAWFTDIESPKTKTKEICIKTKSQIMTQLVSFGFPFEYIKRSLMLEDINHGTATYRLLELHSNN